MMVPDFTLIAEILMFSEGFSSAKVLAKKMVAIMELSQQQLSKQDHYDYGLRSGLGLGNWGVARATTVHTSCAECMCLADGPCMQQRLLRSTVITQNKLTHACMFVDAGPLSFQLRARLAP